MEFTEFVMRLPEEKINIFLWLIYMKVAVLLSKRFAKKVVNLSPNHVIAFHKKRHALQTDYVMNVHIQECADNFENRLYERTVTIGKFVQLCRVM